MTQSQPEPLRDERLRAVSPLALRAVGPRQARDLSRRAVVAAWARRRPLRSAPDIVVIVGLMLLAGHGAWRAASVAAVFLVVLAVKVGTARRATRGLATTRSVLASHVVSLLGHGVAAALTGGILSPLVPGVLAHAAAGLIVFGRGDESRASIGVSAALIVALCFVPRAWAYPAMTSVFYVLLLAYSVLSALVTMRAVANDVSDAYRQARAAADRLREEVLLAASERASRLETISSKVAHELKNPLSAIKGLLKLVDRSPGDDKTHERLDVMQREVARMETILRDYLSFSRPLEDLRTQPVELGVLCDDVIAVLEARAEAAGVNLARGPSTWTIVGDPRRLKEALLNLVGNAVDATPAGGSVRVTVREQDGGARIVIEDSGKGMSEQELQRLGTPFFTTREGGTGLGVVLARAIVTQHGGTLDYESELGKGTRAIIRLPFRPSPPPDA